MDNKKNALQNVRKDSGDVNSGSVLRETLRQAPPCRRSLHRTQTPEIESRVESGITNRARVQSTQT